jgi:hypothetical protein
VSICLGDNRKIDEIDFKYIPEASLEFPAGAREFDEWTTFGAGVTMKNRAIIVPEIAGARGGVGANFKLKPRY